MPEKKQKSPMISPSRQPSSVGSSHPPFSHSSHSSKSSKGHKHGSKCIAATSAAQPRYSQPTSSSSSSAHDHRHAAKLTPGAKPPTSHPRAPSPNYFGLVVEHSNDHGGELSSSSYLPRPDPSPSSSSIKSFAAAIPQQIPLDANPEFEAFRRQADLNRGKSLAIPATSHRVDASPSLTLTRPKPPTRWHTYASDVGSKSKTHTQSSTAPADRRNASSTNMDVDHDSLHDSAYVSSDSKRDSDLSLPPKSILGTQRYESPRSMDSPERRTNLTKSEDRDPRLSMMEHKVSPPSPKKSSVARASTLPFAADEADQSLMITGSRLEQLLKTTPQGRLLLLDIRSSSNFAQARIKGAMNLCIPTTLLKRATFNTTKLQQTFQKKPDVDKFSQWADMHWVIVYDSHSSEKKDAVTAQNMIKKFTNEGFKGNVGILRGGFSRLFDQHPQLVDDDPVSSPVSHAGSHAHRGNLAPVIGGVKMPSSQNEPNPFFSNIRQNMDLADGVGQLEIAPPHGLDSRTLPQWLKDAARQSDHGKQVSDKFLHIEQDEQSRMRNAYAAFNTRNHEAKQPQIQLCGVEKGVKNRYKDILPFEHARVKLEDTGPDDCDYINASHIQASRSNKKYIATQGPLPATFEDFWSVVWEQDVRVIVMLTAETEGGQLKCHPYWKGRDYGPIRLKLLSEKKASLNMDKSRSNSNSHPYYSGGSGEYGRRRASTTTSLDSTPPISSLGGQDETPYVYIRKFAISHSAHPFEQIREVTHLHFASWPDFGTPAQPGHLLALIELANVMQRAAMPFETSSVVESTIKRGSLDALPITWYDEPESDPDARPMLVHCSAGCGRTGTFCTVDSVIDMLKRQKRTGTGESGNSQDVEGDTVMADATSSPARGHSSGARNLYFQRQARRRQSIGKRSYSAHAQIDTSWVPDERLDLIQRTVEDFREQRLSMVQSLRQYVLCYETVLEWVHRADMPPLSAPLQHGQGRGGGLRQQG